MTGERERKREGDRRIEREKDREKERRKKDPGRGGWGEKENRSEG